MSLSFPASPTTGQNYQQWAWDGSKWVPAQGTKQIGARVLLSSNVVAPTSPVASVNIIRTFDNTYDQYELEIYDLQPSIEAALMLRCSTDGSTFDAAASYWASGYSSYSYPTNNSGGAYAQNVTAITLSTLTLSPTAANTFKAQVRFSMPFTNDRQKLFDVKSQHYSGNNGYCSWTGGAWYAVASQAPLKGLQVLLVSGNITRGVFNLYGIVKAGAGGS